MQSLKDQVNMDVEAILSSGDTDAILALHKVARALHASLKETPPDLVID